MKKTLKLYYPYILITFVVAASIIVAVEIFPFESAASLVVFTITVVSLVISFIAFIISLKTYVSIDSVNAITKMDGNVLENENYITSITSLIKEYDMVSSRAVGEAIFKNLEERFLKRSRTAIEFANNLQHFIDLIVFFPSLFNPKDENQEKNIDSMNSILLLIDKRKEDLLSISTGNLILIDETVKLIKCVMNYQKLTHTNEHSITSSLLEVRGTMLKNSVTQTVYYDYLGLFYNKKAMNILRKQFELGKGDIFEIEVLRNIIGKIRNLTNEDAEWFSMYLHESKKAFSKALENCKDDVMWEGFIKYNDARSTFFLQLVSSEYQDKDWQIIMNEAIIARKRLNLLVSDILGDNHHAHLKEAFIHEEYLAMLVKMNILIAQEKDITDTRGIIKYQYPSYDGLLDDKFIKDPYEGQFAKIKEYQDRIKNHINSETKHNQRS